MTYKQIEASREVRLWLSQIIIPACTIAVSTLTIPEVREAVAMKAKSMKRSIETKMKQEPLLGLLLFHFAKNTYPFMKTNFQQKLILLKEIFIMFKKVISMVMVLVVMSGFMVTANAAYESEEIESEIINVDYVEVETEEFDIDMTIIDGCWIVGLTGNDDEHFGYYALGTYDHYPTDEEINVLWASRVSVFELLYNEFGF